MTTSKPVHGTGSTGPLVVLVGAPGSGKTTVGRLLARHWDVEFRDTDHDIEHMTERTVSQVFVEDGEPHFRELERDAVALALAEHRGVLALGAGAVMNDATRQSLRGHSVVHLEVGLAAAMRRLDMNRSRPLLVGNVRGKWQQLAEQRRALYLEVATVTINTDDQTPQRIVDAIVAACDEQEQP